MPKYDAPLKELSFLFKEFINIQQYSDLPGFNEATPELIDSILEEGGKFMSSVLFPLNQVGDQEGCSLEKGEVKTPTGFKEAYQQYTEMGWATLTAPSEYGGQELPRSIGFALSEMAISSNGAFSMYPGLTHGAATAIEKSASTELKEKFLHKMVSGEWTGTMNLTEPQCGTDLGLMTTKAEPQDDGSYAVTGTKIFISAGEHDLSENIIHLVLAKVPGGPSGIKGVSLFLVPKFNVNADGSLGDRNSVMCGSIEHKMGIHGNSTCVMNYDQAKGYLVGDLHKGMRAMFVMMNVARMDVALQGTALSEVAYQNAVEYAKDRRQGRALTGASDPESKADPIIVHPDVRRMLMKIRVFNEGARALGLYIANKIDLSERHPNDEIRQANDDVVALLTPVLKAYFTDKGTENCNDALQVFGGHGYIQEWGMEQFVRDARIAQIYEGANGIQAMDLVGRKLMIDNGRLLKVFMLEIAEFIENNRQQEGLEVFIEPLRNSLAICQKSSEFIAHNAAKNPNELGAAAYDYLYIIALTAMAYTWAQLVAIATNKVHSEDQDKKFYQNKIITAEFFFQRILPEIESYYRKLTAGSRTMMGLAEEDF